MGPGGQELGWKKDPVRWGLPEGGGGGGEKEEERSKREGGGKEKAERRRKRGGDGSRGPSGQTRSLHPELLDNDISSFYGSR